MRKGIITLLVGSVLLAGCATGNQQPRAAKEPKVIATHNIKSIKSAADWQQAADNTAAVIMQKIPNTQQPFYLDQAAGDSLFESAFSNQLAKRLLQSGYPLMPNAGKGALTISVNAERATLPKEIVVATTVADEYRVYFEAVSAYKLKKDHWKSYMPTLPATHIEVKGN